MFIFIVNINITVQSIKVKGKARHIYLHCIAPLKQRLFRGLNIGMKVPNIGITLENI